jgi:Domain of unknown function (DUF4123)
MTNNYMPAIKKQFWPRAAGREVWMIVDGARDRSIYGALLDSYLNYSCLYHGEISPELELAAPYLVQLEYDDSYSIKLIERAWGKSWGVFLKCDSSMDTLRRHLRTLLTVRDQKGSLLLFRYYDPRVLRVYLPTCWEDELKTVYGPIDRFWMEDESPETMLEFRPERGKLRRNEIPLSPDAALAAEAGAEARVL